jgi:hypothetical protein
MCRYNPGSCAITWKREHVFTDAGYIGVYRRPEMKEAAERVRFHIAMRPSRRRTLRDNLEGNIQEAIEKIKAGIRDRAYLKKSWPYWDSSPQTPAKGLRPLGSFYF